MGVFSGFHFQCACSGRCTFCALVGFFFRLSRKDCRTALLLINSLIFIQTYFPARLGIEGGGHFSMSLRCDYERSIYLVNSTHATPLRANHFAKLSAISVGVSKKSLSKSFLPFCNSCVLSPAGLKFPFQLSQIQKAGLHEALCEHSRAYIYGNLKQFILGSSHN